jgi:aminobenzoyl-glutamate utilization protein B
MKETKSSKVLSEAKAQGFRVTTGVAEIPTAFIAEYGSGLPIIGILGEFDALPGLSQKRKHQKKSEGAPGHGWP